MVRVTFKNLKPSELVKDAVNDKLKDDFERFPDLREQDVRVTVAMENSPHKSGPDLFAVRFNVTGGRYRGVILEKKAQSFYLALADLNENLVERLNRFGDKRRVTQRKQARQQSLVGS